MATAQTKTVTPSPEEKAKAKADKFVKLAKPRIDKALKSISRIGNLSNKSSYDYTPEQVTKITEALTGAVKSTMGKFSPDAKASAEGFQFS